MVTVKNKEQFEKWYELNDCEYDLILFDFYTLPFEMQIGVYLAYYDSKGIILEMGYINEGYFFYISDGYSILKKKYRFETRIEAYKAALKEADILMNKFLKQ